MPDGALQQLKKMIEDAAGPRFFASFNGEPARVLRETVLMPLSRPRHAGVRAVGVPGRTPATSSKVELRLRRSAALGVFPRPARWRRQRARPAAERRGRA